jgi:hypothetical protein
MAASPAPADPWPGEIPGIGSIDPDPGANT